MVMVMGEGLLYPEKEVTRMWHLIQIMDVQNKKSKSTTEYNHYPSFSSDLGNIVLEFPLKK